MPRMFSGLHFAAISLGTIGFFRNFSLILLIASSLVILNGIRPSGQYSREILLNTIAGLPQYTQKVEVSVSLVMISAPQWPQV